VQSKKRILCVDDDVDTCEMLHILLGSAGYEVTFATSVTEGLSLAKSGQCDLIILDGLFHDGTGVELCRMIRAFDSETPIVFCSGAARQSDIAEAMSAGAQEYLTKPCNLEQIEQTVITLTRAERTSARRMKISSNTESQARELVNPSGELINGRKKRKNEGANPLQPR
jgi:DNA-binding response OmpR family regulator